MGQRLSLFLDTPVLARWVAGESALVPPDEDVVITGVLNLFELVHLLTKRGATRGAEAAFATWESNAQGLTRTRIFEASRLRVRLRDRGLSYADAAGYVTARELGAAFLTTDRGFQGLPGVRILTP